GGRPSSQIVEGDEVLVAVKHYALTPDQEQLIFGGVLGDGALRRSTHNVRFRVGLGEKQYEYADWKHDFLAPFAHGLTPTGKGTGFDTIPMSQLAWLHESVYPTGGGKQAVTKELVQKL